MSDCPKKEQNIKVIGIPVRLHNGQRQIGTHRPTKAVLAGNRHQRTTVGGMIDGAEIAIYAMWREFGEEYGFHMLEHCKIRVINPELYEHQYESASGEIKQAFLYWIDVRDNVEPVIDRSEVYSYHWDDFENICDVFDLMSRDRRRLFYKLFENAALRDE